PRTGGIFVGKLSKALAVVASTLIAGLGLAACGDSGDSGGGEAHEGGSMTATLTSFPDYLDPQLSYTLEGWEGLWNTYVPLLTYKHENGDETTKPVPGLAESMPKISPDGKTYTLTLRKGVKYSDGTPVKASDFAATIERDFKVDSPGVGFFGNIVGADEFGKKKTGP